MRLMTRVALVALAIGAGLSAQTYAQAQGPADVQIFEDTPSIEQLRAILIPESLPGASRKIVLPGRDAAAPSSPVQPAAATGPVAATSPATAHSSAPMPVAMPTAMPAAMSAPMPTVDMPAAAAPPVPASMPVSMPAPRHERAAAPAARQAAQEEPGAVGFRINFAFNSAAIPRENQPQLDRMVQLMKEVPTLALSIEGHTDAVGSADYNLDLSRQRALSVARYLVSQGVDPERLEAVGKGKSEPLTADPYAPQNRRVQFLRREVGRPT
jgi:outer membrane protein OmpA-like peptidoglycan-associated protein